MTISKVMGVTNYSAVMDVADSNISNIMGVAQGGGGGATLLEGFEGTPLNALNGGTWVNFNLSSATRTTSNVTQGTYSWRLQGDSDPSGGGTGLTGTTVTFDLTSYTSILLDVFVATTTADTAFFIACEDIGGDYAEVQTADGVSGSFTVTLDISSMAVRNDSFFYIIMFGSGSGGTCDFYIDNLRAS